MPKPLPELLADLRAERTEGVLDNVLTELEAQNAELRLLEMARRIRGRLADGPAKSDEAARRAYVAPLLTEVEDELVDRVEGPPLGRLRAPALPPLGMAWRRMLGDPRGGRRGGYRNVFEQWRTQYIPVRNDPQMGPDVENQILRDLQTMYNDAAIAVETGTHVSPPQKVVFDTYDALITPVAMDPNRTPGDLLRMLSALESRLPAPPTSGGRRSQSAKFGSCVKAVRKTVKVRKGSSAEGAAIAICTKSMLFPRGRTIKRYRKGRLYTQKRK